MIVANTGIRANRFEADAVARRNGGRLPNQPELDKYKVDGNPGSFWAREWSVKGVLVEKGKDFVFDLTNARIEAKDVQKMLELHQALEEKLHTKIPIEKLLYLLDPSNPREPFAFKNGLYVPVDPKITVVENAVLEDCGRGIADPETKIAVHPANEVLEKILGSLPEEIGNKVRLLMQKGATEKEILNSLPDNMIRWNNVGDGVWPLNRGPDFCQDENGKHRVLDRPISTPGHLITGGHDPFYHLGVLVIMEYTKK